MNPSKQLSLTETAASFGVSKTLISDDIELISGAIEEEGIGSVLTDRGRTGGAYFVPSTSPNLRNARMSELCEQLSVRERMLPGGLVFYTDTLFDPEWASFLGFTMSSLFSARKPDVVMTTEVKGIPIAFFTAYALGVPLAVCRFRNRPSDGSAVGVHFQTGSGDVRTMYLSTRCISSGSRVLIVDDFMRGGSTAYGMLSMASEFDADVVGVGVFISSVEPQKKAIADYKALLELSVVDDLPSLSVSKDLLEVSQDS